MQSTGLGQLDVSMVGVADGVDVGLALGVCVADGVVAEEVGVDGTVADLVADGVGVGADVVISGRTFHAISMTTSATTRAAPTTHGQRLRFCWTLLVSVNLLTPSGRYSRSPCVADVLVTL